MEKQQTNRDGIIALKKALYDDPSANVRIRIENSKKQFEKAKHEGTFKPSLPTQQKIFDFPR